MVKDSPPPHQPKDDGERQRVKEHIWRIVRKLTGRLKRSSDAKSSE